MHTLLCAGGSATRVLEAVLHLCAAGLGPPELKVMVIDPDKANGNFSRVKGLLEKYVECQQIYGGRLGQDLRLFGTRLDLLDPEGQEGGERGLKIWTPVQPDDTLHDLLNYDVLKTTRTSPDVVHLLFTKAELDEKLGQGFRGHPAIGAAALSLISLHAKNPPWAQLIARLKIELGKTDGSRVCVAGSVFGGTGASAIHPIARFIRTIPEISAERLKIGVVAMVPYFSFVQPTGQGVAAKRFADGRLAAKSEWFALATQGAIGFYQHLRENNDWPFDAVYWVGDADMMKVKYCPGGPEQANPAHFVDLLAALAALEFLQLPQERLRGKIGCAFAGPRQDTDLPEKKKSLIDWLDLPLMHLKRQAICESLLRFFLVGAVHLGFGVPLMEFGHGAVDRRPYCVPWYLDRFRRRSLRTEDNAAAIKKLADFFEIYHFPWWSQIVNLENSTDVRMFNRTPFRAGQAGKVSIDLARLANLVWPDLSAGAKPDPLDDFFTAMVKVPKEKGGAGGAPDYLAVLAHAGNRYIERVYRNAD